MNDLVCKACDQTWPRPDHFIADMGLSTAYLHEDQSFTGWTVVVLKRHATELFHLTATERIQLMEEVSLIAQLLQRVFDARKINYELLGNQLPHIHWHIIPRGAGDPAPLEPVWRVPHDPVSLQSTALQERIGKIQAELKRARHIS